MAHALANGADHGSGAACVAVLAADGEAGDGAVHEAVGGEFGGVQEGVVDRAARLVVQIGMDA